MYLNLLFCLLRHDLLNKTNNHNKESFIFAQI